MKVLKEEKNIIKFVEEYYSEIGLGVITVFALIMRICMVDFRSEDYELFLSPWFDYLKNNGGLKALGSYQGNYNAPYMTIMALLTYLPVYKLYLIKAVSIAFDFALALASSFLVKHLVSKNQKLYFLITYFTVLFLPEVVMNSAIWGQCDSGYATFVVLALLYLFKEKYFKSFVMLGIAFALKLQFIFILPVFIIVYFVKKKFSILNFLIIPAVNFILCLPAIIMGKPIGELILVYFNQIDQYKSSISLNILNIYGLIIGNARELHSFGIFLTMSISLMMLLFILYKKVKLDNQKILNLSLWFVVVTTFLLPRMHERYIYVGAILSLVYFILYRKNLLVFIGITICSIITYFDYLYGSRLANKDIIIIAYAVILAFYTKDLFRILCGDKK